MVVGIWLVRRRLGARLSRLGGQAVAGRLVPPSRLLNHDLGPWLVLVINDNVRLYVTNVCFAEQMVS